MDFVDSGRNDCLVANESGTKSSGNVNCWYGMWELHVFSILSDPKDPIGKDSFGGISLQDSAKKLMRNTLE